MDGGRGHTLEQIKSLVPEGLTTLMFEVWMSEQTCDRFSINSSNMYTENDYSTSRGMWGRRCATYIRA